MRLRNLMPQLWNRNCFKIVHLVFLLIFGGVMQITANPYTDLAVVDSDLLLSPSQQTSIVTGKVTDSQTGEAMPGVNVLIKGTITGVMTDFNGNYSLPVTNKDAIFVFSFIGYATQEVSLSGRTVINVSLVSQLTGLEEVVVIGYGTQSRYTVTGSIASVDMAKSQDLPNLNITQSLSGVPGVQFTGTGRPGQSGALLIRGQNSLSAGNDPLIVLDGIIFSGALSDINPQDIKSMEVLKDASSASIYGARAANGVILITSKAGNTEKASITFNAFYGLSDWAYTIPLLSPERYVERRLDWRRINGLEADPSKAASYLTVSEAENYNNGISHNPWDIISQQGSILSYDLSISGKTDRTNYYLSGSLSNDKGLIFNDQERRTTVRANITNNARDWLTIGMTSTFSHRDLSGINASINSAYRNSPFGTWKYPDGEPTQYPVPEENAGGNPLFASLLTDNEEIYDFIFSNLFAEIDLPFIKGLSYRLNYSPNYRWGHNYNFVKQSKYLTYNNTSASKLNQNTFNWVLENIVNFKRDIGENHSIDITLLYGRDRTNFESTTANSTQFSIDVLGYNNLGLGGIPTISSNASVQNGVSSMARLNYQFMKKYMFTLTARRDGSSVFAANNKYATFPSAALAWMITDEPFMDKAKIIDMLKLRVSYGAIGNQAISPYQSLSLSSTQRYVFGDGGPSTIGVVKSSLGNDGLKWETVYSANAAVDFSLFNNRISGTLEVYNSTTKNLLVSRAIPVMTGYTNIMTNIGETNNRGVELLFNTVNLQKSKFQWNSSISVAYNKNKIVHLFQTDLDSNGREDDVVANNWFIGYPIKSYYDYVFDGIYQEGDETIPAGSSPGFVRVKDITKDGKITPDDRTIVGSGGNPDWQFGFMNEVSYNNFSLSVFVNGMLGWIAQFNLINPLVPDRSLNQIDAGWWTPENKSNSRPALNYSNPLKTNWYVSRDFARIRDLSLSYTFDKNLLGRINLTNLRIYMSVKNLYTFTNWLGSDPESGGDYSSEQGSENLFPMPRTFSLGCNVTF